MTKDFNFSNARVLVSGGTRGIGRAIAEQFLKSGAETHITGRQAKPEWMAPYPKAYFHALDFTQTTSFTDFLKVLSQLDLDVLINNAGVFVPQDIAQLSADVWSETLHANLTGPALMIKAVVPKMKLKPIAYILNIGSTAALTSKPKQAAYSASKAGITGLTRAVSADLAEYNILVNCLCPGPTQTDMLDELLDQKAKEKAIDSIPLKRLGAPQDIASAAVFLCSEFNTYITGQTILADGGKSLE